jgi:hypothetical protein
MHDVCQGVRGCTFNVPGWCVGCKSGVAPIQHGLASQEHVCIELKLTGGSVVIVVKTSGTYQASQILTYLTHLDTVLITELCCQSLKAAPLQAQVRFLASTNVLTCVLQV